MTIKKFLTLADIYDGKVLAPVLDGTEKKVYADKLYSVKENRNFLRTHGITLWE